MDEILRQTIKQKINLWGEMTQGYFTVQCKLNSSHRKQFSHQEHNDSLMLHLNQLSRCIN